MMAQGTYTAAGQEKGKHLFGKRNCGRGFCILQANFSCICSFYISIPDKSGFCVTFKTKVKYFRHFGPLLGHIYKCDIIEVKRVVERLRHWTGNRRVPGLKSPRFAWLRQALCVFEQGTLLHLLSASQFGGHLLSCQSCLHEFSDIITVYMIKNITGYSKTVRDHHGIVDCASKTHWSSLGSRAKICTACLYAVWWYSTYEVCTNTGRKNQMSLILILHYKLNEVVCFQETFKEFVFIIIFYMLMF